MSYECFSISCDAFLLRSVISSHDLGFSEKSFLSEIWVSMGVSNKMLLNAPKSQGYDFYRF